MERMRIAIISDTPYQLMNSINFMANNRNFQYDLFIGQQFRNCEQITAHVGETGLAEHIYPYECVKYRNILIRYAMKLKETLQLEQYLKKCTYWKFAPSENEYDYIAMSLYTNFTEAFKIYYSSIPVVFYDDGFGTYSGNTVPVNYGVRKTVSKLLGKEFPDLTPCAVYLNNPEAYSIPYISNVKKMPELNLENVAFPYLLKVFSAAAPGKYQNKAVFLTQPNDFKFSMYGEIIERIIMILRESISVIVRVHPRENIEDYQKFGVDIDDDSLWELSCMTEITNDNVLIGIYSSSQIMPKIMFNKEPYLLFLYKVFEKMYTVEQFKMIADIVGDVIDKYSNNHKIFTPENLDELSLVIKKLHNERIL